MSQSNTKDTNGEEDREETNFKDMSQSNTKDTDGEEDREETIFKDMSQSNTKDTDGEEDREETNFKDMSQSNTKDTDGEDAKEEDKKKKVEDNSCWIFLLTVLVVLGAVVIIALILGLTLGLIREGPFTNSTSFDVNSTSSVAPLR